VKNPLAFDDIKVFPQKSYHNGIYRISRRERSLMEIASEFARYFQREHHYTFPPFDTTSDLDGRAVYLIGSGGAWLGACGFSPVGARSKDVPPANWMLDWAWLHPFYRQKRLLSNAWPEFEAAHGEFLILEPLSLAMQAFIEARGVAKDRVISLGS
jgi:hypothetical protein